MAFAGANFRPIDPRRGSPSRSRISRGLVYGTIAAGFGIVASCWMMATVATMQVATSLNARDSGRFERSLALQPIVRAVPAERRVQGSKFSRIPLPMAERIAQSGLTPDAIKSSRMRIAMLARLTSETAGHGKRNGLTAEAIRLSFTRSSQVASIPSARQTQDIVAVASATPADLDNGFSANATAVLQPTPTLATALVETSATDKDTLQKPFSLVLADPGASFSDDLPDSIPLPVSRPETLTKAVLERPAEEEKRPGKKELAYADPSAAIDDEDEDAIPAIPRRRGGKIAYYDISAGVVHMPNGEKLEAHSGIGAMRDNPKFTHVKMRGPTPAGTYRITMREKLFHGVEAVRLTPTNGIAPLGRTGLLAHSYLLRKRGDSHGCVAFADYPRFLKAFKRGEVDTMVIVHKMSGWRSFTASADDGKAKSSQKVVR